MKRLQLLILSGLFISIAGCGPKTQTIYKAPLDIVGKQCIQRCETDAQRAQLWEELEYKDCLAYEYRGQVRDLRRDGRRARRDGKRMPRYNRFFNDAEFTCSRVRGFSSQNLYDRCFQGCGGSIEVKLLESQEVQTSEVPATSSTLSTVGAEASPL